MSAQHNNIQAHMVRAESSDGTPATTERRADNGQEKH